MTKHAWSSPGNAGALVVCADARVNPLCFVERHARLERGVLCPADIHANEDALEQGLRLLSAFTLPDGVRILVSTESDRSGTTVLLPEE